jgi:hypothetical protein
LIDSVIGLLRALTSVSFLRACRYVYSSYCAHTRVTCAQHVIKNDLDVGHQITKPGDFDRSDMRSAEEMLTIWKEAKKIFLNARDCKDGSRDENAWCDDVVRPLVHLAIELYGGDRWWFQNVYVELDRILKT